MTLSAAMSRSRAAGLVGRRPARGAGVALVRAAGRPRFRRLAHRPVVVAKTMPRGLAQIVEHGRWWLAPRARWRCSRALRHRRAARWRASGAARWLLVAAPRGLALFVAAGPRDRAARLDADWLDAAVRRAGRPPGRHRRGRRAGADRAACPAVDRAGAARRLRRRRLRRRRDRRWSPPRSCSSPPGRSCASWCRPSRTATAPSRRRCARPARRPTRSGACAA